MRGRTLAILSCLVSLLMGARAPCEDESSASTSDLEKAISTVETAVAAPTPTPTPSPDATKEREAKAKGLIRAAVKYIKEEWQSQQRTEATASFGLRGDDAPPYRSLYNIATEFELQRGSYPSEMKVKSAAAVQFEDGAVKEDVTTILVNYGRYLNRWLQTYAFVERFSDTYMSIRQRYEAGFGVMFNVSSGATPTGDKRTRALQALCETDVKTLAESIKRTDDEVINNALATLRDAGCGGGDIDEAMRRRHSRVDFGLALSPFWELEHPEMAVYLDQLKDNVLVPTDKTTTVSLAGDHQLRVAIRPSIRYRPHDALTLYTEAYFKLPIEHWSREWFDAEGAKIRRVDWRFEPMIKAELKVGDKTVVSVLWQWRYDARPPQLSPDDFERLNAGGPGSPTKHPQYIVRNPTATAKDKHETLVLKVAFGL